MLPRLSTLKAALVAVPMLLGACAAAGTGGSTGMTASSKNPEATYAMRWDHQPGAASWTSTGVAALRSHGAALPATVPQDISTWCPGYVDASRPEREAFWIGLISALAKYESTWNPTAVGGGGRWFGLVQISPATARQYGCKATSGSALKNGADNVSCAIRIMARTVLRDGVVSRGMGGVAADWGPFHHASARNDMMAWTSAQPFCQPKKQAALSKAFKAGKDG